jgi:hypothetical protein
MLNKLKVQWGIENNTQLIIGVIVFVVSVIVFFLMGKKYEFDSIYLFLSGIFILVVSFFTVKYYFKIGKYLMKKWDIVDDIQYALIFIVFAITGSSSVKLARPILEFLGISNELPWYMYWPLRIIIILPVYQILLICFGTLFGQFKFFWAFEKKMFSRFNRSKKV